MKREEYLRLYEKCASGNCTGEELKILEAYEDDFNLEEVPWEENQLGNKEQVLGSLYQTLQDKIKPEPKKLWIYKPHMQVAASVTLMAFCLFLFFLRQHKPVVADSKQSTQTGLPVSPGGNKAELILANGSRIVLDTSLKGKIADQSDVEINKTKDGNLVYNQVGAAAPEIDPSQVSFNIIRIPRGGEYQLTLSDGSKVWLNAASSLKFPTLFKGRERRVELVGEAYFEVSENKKMPFVVVAGGTSVEVLGTHFNVDAYPGKSEATTTLLEGSVRLKKADAQQLLQPGQAGRYSRDKAFEVKKVDVEEAVAWKNGFFIFQDKNIRDIMVDAANWYDLEVEYRGDLRNKRFWGKTSRYDNIHELLKNLELTGSIHFKLEGRRVIVMP